MIARLLTVASALAAGAAGAQTVEINFDDLPNNTIVTDQYPEATFSSSPGNNNTAFSFGGADSPPNIICTPACIEDTYIDFTDPVSDLTFWAIEANRAGVTAQFNIYVNGAFAATVDFVSAGGSPHNEFVDLSAFADVTRLEIVNIVNDPSGENGIGWDTFTFTVGGQCPADFNGDGVVDTRDVLAFLNAWSSGDPSGDFNGDGVIDTRDVLAFLNTWTQGC